ncbi:SRPBCC family protein [Longispora urticae]
MTTTEQHVQVYRVYINATPQAIWDAITTPEWTEKFGYGGRSVYDLTPGGAYRGYASAEMVSMGAPELAVDGEVIESDPPKKLVQTWRMLMDEEMAAEGFSTLTYEIKPGEGGVTSLTVTHDLTGQSRLRPLMSGRLADTGAGGGWAWVLSSLKTLLETGAPLNWPG